MRSLACALIAWVALACDYDIPSLPGGAAPVGGSGGSGGGEGCLFTGCPECLAPRVCDPEMGCVECRNNSDCTEQAPICDAFRCVQCTTSDISNCETNNTCFNGQCDNVCNDNSDCNGFQGCFNPTCEINRCVCCTDNANCVQENVAICADDGICHQCQSDNDCVAVFDDGSRPKCGPDGNCHGCLVAEDCKQPAVCDVDGVCVPRCCTTSDCVPGSDAPVCDEVTQLCTTCSSTRACPVGTCDVATGRCIECESDGECSTSLPACVNNVCRECGPTQPCVDPNICIDGVCFAPA